MLVTVTFKKPGIFVGLLSFMSSALLKQLFLATLFPTFLKVDLFSLTVYNGPENVVSAIGTGKPPRLMETDA